MSYSKLIENKLINGENHKCVILRADKNNEGRATFTRNDSEHQKGTLNFSIGDQQYQIDIVITHTAGPIAGPRIKMFVSVSKTVYIFMDTPPKSSKQISFDTHKRVLLYQERP